MGKSFFILNSIPAPVNPPPPLPQFPSAGATTSIGSDARAILHYQAHSKSTALAYALWFFLGTVGAHRFYAGRTGSAVVMLVIFLISLPLCFILVGFVGVFAVLIWALVDAFLIAGWIREHNSRLAQQLSS